MSRCVLALQFEGYYLSIQCCTYDRLIEQQLNAQYCSQQAAESIVSGGDISCFTNATPTYYQEAFGYTWAQVKPVIHQDHGELINHCLSIGAAHLLRFDGKAWQKISLITDCQEPVFESLMVA